MTKDPAIFADATPAGTTVSAPPRTYEEAVDRLDVETARRLYAEAELRAIEERFRQFSEHAGKFMWMSDPQTHELLYVSPGFEQVWAPSRERDYASPQAWTASFRLPGPGSRRSATGREEFYKIAAEDGSVRWIRDRMVPIRDGDGQVVRVLGVAEDITEAKQLREALHVNEKKWRSLAAVSPDMVFRVRKDGTVLEYKPGADRSLSAAGAEFVGRNIRELLPAHLAAEARRQILQALRSGNVQTFEAQYLLPDEVRDFEARGVACGEDEVLAVLHDITDRKRLEREIIEISSREQQRIGEDLHDGLGQHLTGITFLIRALERRLEGRSPEEAREAAEIGRLVMQALAQTRNLARGLFPAELERQGLVAAITELTADVERMCKVRCSFRADSSIDVTDQVIATHVFRIAQEAVNNAVKHGKARSIEVTLMPVHDHLELSVADDGAGFAPDAKMDGLGLRIMNYRARKIGGALEVAKPDQGGIRVTCSFRKKYESN